MIMKFLLTLCCISSLAHVAHGALVLTIDPTANTITLSGSDTGTTGGYASILLSTSGGTLNYLVGASSGAGSYTGFASGPGTVNWNITVNNLVTPTDFGFTISGSPSFGNTHSGGINGGGSISYASGGPIETYFDNLSPGALMINIGSTGSAVTYSAVPEPSSMIVLSGGLALGAIVYLRRRRRCTPA